MLGLVLLSLIAVRAATGLISHSIAAHASAITRPNFVFYRFSPLLLLSFILFLSTACHVADSAPTYVLDPMAILFQDNNTGVGDRAVTSADFQTSGGGYTSKVSVLPGESLNFHISYSSSKPYSLTLYREGATRVRMGVIDGVRSDNAGCAGRYATGCNWPVAATFTVPNDWPSGIYTVDIPRDTGPTMKMLFFVRPRTPSARILFLTSVNTYQAYNDYGGGSLYGFDGALKVQKVSFNRPYNGGSGFLNRWEGQFVSWAEAAGYEMDYAATYDLEFTPDLLAGYDVAIIAGHSEYWTYDMRQRMKAFVTRGGRFMNLSGNTMWWQVRFEDNGRTMVGYKDWREDPLKDAELSTDVNWDHPINDSSFSVTGLHWPYGGYPGAVGLGYYAVNTDHWIYNGTGLAENALFGKGPTRESSIHDKESDGLAFNCAADGSTILGPVAGTGTPGNFTILGLTPVHSNERDLDGVAMMGYYTTPRGGAVFSAGTTGWMLGLDQPAVDRITRNLLDRFLSGNFPQEPVGPDSDYLFSDRFNCYALNRGRFSSESWIDDASRLNYIQASAATQNRLTTACGVEGSGLEMTIGQSGTRYVASLGPNWQATERLNTRFYLNLSGINIANGAVLTLFQQYADDRNTTPAAVASLEIGKVDNRLVARYQPTGGNLSWVPVPANGFFLVETIWNRAAGRVGIRIDDSQGYLQQLDLSRTPALNRADFGVLAKKGTSGGRICIDELIYEDPTSSEPPTPIDTSTPTATATPTDTPDPFITPSVTATPTETPTPITTLSPTPSPTSNPVSDLLYISSTVRGNARGTLYSDEDILAYDRSVDGWSLFFDGSDVGLAVGDIDAFQLLNDGTLLLSLHAPLSIAGLGLVDDSDILRFIPVTIGAATAGVFEMYVDGSDVELTTDAEDIDAIGLLPNGDLLISTRGKVSVGGLIHADEDLLRLSLTQTGQNTQGTWSLYFDGSDVGLSGASEDIVGVWVDRATGWLYLNTLGDFSVTGLNGKRSDIFICTPITLGANTNCDFEAGFYWQGRDAGLNIPLDGLAINRG